MKFIDNLIIAFVKSRIKKYIERMKKMAENEKKPWYLSTGVIGGLVAIAIAVVSQFKFGKQLEGEEVVITETILRIVTALAGALAVYGRVKAKKSISIK
jgi:hypothetical protein